VLVIRNGGSACELAGPLRIRVVAKKQAPLDQLGTATPVSLFLARGAAGEAPIRWSNWCGGLVRGLSVELLVTRGKLFAPFTEAPPCNGPGQPSTIELKTFAHRK
jgi:hypothetical protein